MSGAFADCAIDIPVDSVIVGDRVRKNLGEMVPLQVSMTRVGQLQPIGITAGNELVFGLRRLEAARAMAWETIRAVRLDSLTDAGKLALAEQDENTCREPFSPLELLEMAKRIDAVLPKSKGGRPPEKTVPTVGTVSGEESKTAQNSAKPPKTAKDRTEKKEPKPKKRREQIAKAVGTSHENLRRIETVAQAAESDPEKFGPVAAEMEATGNVAAAYEAVQEATEPDNGEALRGRILDRIGATLEKAIRELCDTEAGRNVDRAKALDLLGKLVAVVRGEKPAVHPQGESAILEFPCDGTPNVWKLTEQQAAEWAELFPSLDIVAQCRSALAWVKASKDRQKTFRGMPKFLVGWFSRSQDSGKHRSNEPRDKLSGLKAFVYAGRRGIETSPGVELIGGPNDFEE